MPMANQGSIQTDMGHIDPWLFSGNWWMLFAKTRQALFLKYLRQKKIPY